MLVNDTFLVCLASFLFVLSSKFNFRKYELHQVAQQASNIEDLTEVIRESLSVMSKQWADAMKTFHDKFHSLSTLITDNGICHFRLCVEVSLISS